MISYCTPGVTMDPTLIAALGHDGVTVANLADKDTLKDAGE